MLERLNRMEPAPAAPPADAGGTGASCGPGDARRARPGPSRRRARGVADRCLSSLVAFGAYAAVASDGDWRAMLAPAERPIGGDAGAVARDVVLALPRRGETALTRAREPGGWRPPARCAVGPRRVCARPIRRSPTPIASAPTLAASSCCGWEARVPSREVLQVRLPRVRERRPVPQLRVRLLAVAGRRAA